MINQARRLLAAVAVIGGTASVTVSAEAANLTAEQQAIVEKYGISKADQEKLFAGQTASANEAPAEVAFAEDEASSSVPAFLKGTYVFGGVDTYKSIGDRVTNIAGGPGALSGSFGGVAGFNSGFTLTESNIGLQAGASYGIYDFKGRLGIVPDDVDTETQLFYTAGVYKRGNMTGEGGSLADRLSLGLVYDGFEAERWGVNANNIKLGQVRGTVGFALNSSTEIGAWGTYGVTNDDAAVTVAGAPGVRRNIRPMNQTNFYLKHAFDFGGDITAYAGVLDSDDIGKWQVGATGRVPLSRNWATYAGANYVVPSSSSGPGGSGEEQFSAQLGLSYFFGGNAASSSVTGNRYLPLQDVANTRTFLVTD